MSVAWPSKPAIGWCIRIRLFGSASASREPAREQQGGRRHRDADAIVCTSGLMKFIVS